MIFIKFVSTFVHTFGILLSKQKNKPRKLIYSNYCQKVWPPCKP